MRWPWSGSKAPILTALLALVLTAPAARAADKGGGWLGVTMQSLNDALRDGMGFDGEGVLVNRVEPDGPADHAGVRKGDVITSFNSRDVSSPATLSEMVGATAPGRTVSLGLWRRGERQTLTVRLGSRPADLETRERIRMDSGDGDEDDSGPPAPPRAPEAPAPPEPPTAPHGLWMDRDLQGMPEMRRALRAMGMTGRGRLGVQVQDLDPQLGDYFGVTDGKGVLIASVTDDSPASRAGFKAGDVILKVGDRAVEDSGDLVDALRDRPAGRVDVTVLRRGQRMTLTPELAERPNAGAPGEGWKRLGPGDWQFDGPGGDRHIRIRRSEGDRDVRIQALDEGDRADLRRQIDELKRQVEELKRQVEESKRR